jgi:hypothetical protein
MELAGEGKRAVIDLAQSAFRSRARGAKMVSGNVGTAAGRGETSAAAMESKPAARSLESKP